jgi:hypothetical protein
MQHASFFREKVRFLHESTVAVYIKLYKRQDYPMKGDVTNVQFYKVFYYPSRFFPPFWLDIDHPKEIDITEPDGEYTH